MKVRRKSVDTRCIRRRHCCFALRPRFRLGWRPGAGIWGRGDPNTKRKQPSIPDVARARGYGEGGTRTQSVNSRVFPTSRGDMGKGGPEPEAETAEDWMLSMHWVNSQSTSSEAREYIINLTFNIYLLLIFSNCCLENKSSCYFLLIHICTCYFLP